MTTDWKKLPFIEKVKQNPEAFGKKVIEICKSLGIAPEWLMVVMNNESGLQSAIKNPTSSASGLIQFMEQTAKALGTTTADLRAMSNVDQLDYVYRYMKPYASKIKDVSDVYLSIFFPAALYKTEAFVFPTWASNANKIFDLSKDGQLTKPEFRNYVNNKYSKYVPTSEEFKKKSAISS
jgi:hypothetical protein